VRKGQPGEEKPGKRKRLGGKKDFLYNADTLIKTSIDSIAVCSSLKNRGKGQNVEEETKRSSRKYWQRAKTRKREYSGEINGKKGKTQVKRIVCGRCFSNDEAEKE